MVYYSRNFSVSFLLISLVKIKEVAHTCALVSYPLFSILPVASDLKRVLVSYEHGQFFN